MRQGAISTANILRNLVGILSALYGSRLDRKRVTPLITISILSISGNKGALTNTPGIVDVFSIVNILMRIGCSKHWPFPNHW